MLNQPPKDRMLRSHDTTQKRVAPQGAQHPPLAAISTNPNRNLLSPRPARSATANGGNP